MSQEIISINRFDGMMTNPHKEDIPDNMGVYVFNVDPKTELGVLRGVKVIGDAYTANSAQIPNVYEADWIKYERVDATLSVIDASNTNPIIIETAANNLVTGDKVVIAGCTGNTAANGTWRIIALTTTTFSIPIAGNGAYTGSGVATYTGGVKWDLVYLDTDGNDITIIEDFYNSVTTYRTLNDKVTSGVSPICVRTFNNMAQIGNNVSHQAFVIYRLLAHKHFFNNDETILAGVKDERGECYNLGTGAGSIYPTAVSFHADTGYFQADTYYKWAMSLVYDGLQESNLIEGAGNYSATESDYVTVTITANGMRGAGGGGGDINILDSRVTAVKLYRADSSDKTAGSLGLYRLITTIDINSGSDDGDLWADDTDNYALVYDDDGSFPDGGATYEEETGMPESLVRQSIRYSVNEVGGGYHWVTGGVPEGQSGDWLRYIFRSKKFRPNMFDWARDFLVLPEIPTALMWFENYLYAFSENTTYKINPELFAIEDSFFGAGCGHRQSVTTTEYGMFWCDKNNAYMMRGGQIVTISDPISETPRTENYLSWKLLASNSYDTSTATNFGRIVVKYETDKRTVFFIGRNTSNKSLALGYYLPTEQWYGFSLTYPDINNDSGIFNGKDGEIYLSNATNLKRLFNGTDYEGALWASKEFHLGEPSQNKSWNMIKWDATVGTGSVAVTYGTDGTSAIGGTSATSGSWINTYKKTLQVYLVTTGNAVIDSIDIIPRRLFGKR